MRPLIEMQTIQIEITNACGVGCSNCTRLVGHHAKPFFMSMEQFKEAVDSMVGLPKSCLVGMMGGEPLLHPKFEEMCEYMRSKIDPSQLGLWTCLPEGKEKYRETICNTFKHIFLNDHTRNDIMHTPVLVASEEIPAADWMKWYWIDKCWVQMSWSACINPHGAFFCEIAGALSMLLSKKPDGWKVEPGWWTRIPKDFKEQMEKYCTKCGAAMPLKKRCSNDKVDDISPKMLERLEVSSPKVKSGNYVVSDLQLVEDKCQMATYKDPNYRDKIAERYGMFLMLNEMNYQTPFLLKKWKKGGKDGEVV